jgi:hypothetical protein
VKRTLIIAGAAGLALVFAFGAIVATGGNGRPEDAAAAEDPVEKQLAQVRAATARYQRVEQALADGYIADSVCIESMGIHYVKPSLMDMTLNITQPEILLYAKHGEGGLRLVAVEYFKPDADQDLTTSNDRPSLFGQPFDGPMPGHAPGMPIHYDLHVWLWQHNPAGMFAQWNPTVTCN